MKQANHEAGGAVAARFMKVTKTFAVTRALKAIDCDRGRINVPRAVAEALRAEVG